MARDVRENKTTDLLQVRAELHDIPKVSYYNILGKEYDLTLAGPA